MKMITTILVALLVLVVVFATTRKIHAPNPVPTSTATTSDKTGLPARPSLSEKDQVSAVNAYVRKNISTLSPEGAQLGGTFYVTAIEASAGCGVVQYEDGHNDYTADFFYVVDAQGKVAIGHFTVR